MGDCFLLSRHVCGCQASAIRNTQNQVGDARSLSLAIAGVTSEAARSRVLNSPICIFNLEHTYTKQA